MGFQDFDIIGDFKVKCKTCGLELPTGIVSLSEHWVKCTGKNFTSEIMANANAGKLTLEKVDELNKKHFNS